MANLETTIPHKLSQEEAVERVKSLLTKVKEDNAYQIKDLKEVWNGNVGEFSFTVQKFDISGTLTVGPASIELQATVPFTVSLFKGAIIKAIDKKAAELLV